MKEGDNNSCLMETDGTSQSATPAVGRRRLLLLSHLAAKRPNRGSGLAGSGLPITTIIAAISSRFLDARRLQDREVYTDR